MTPRRFFIAGALCFTFFLPFTVKIEGSSAQRENKLKSFQTKFFGILRIESIEADAQNGSKKKQKKQKKKKEKNKVNPNQVPADCRCQELISISAIEEVLYKPVNEHGGRGPSYLVQSFEERLEKKTLDIFNTKCKRIGRFGLWANDWPYGARYYQGAPRGSNLSAAELRRRARQGTNQNTIWVEARGEKRCIVIKNPLKREGVVY